MTKLVVLKLNGDLSQGVQVTLEIGEEGDRPKIEIISSLPSAPEVATAYEQWQSNYCSLARSARIEAKAIIKDGDITQLHQKCFDCAVVLRKRLNHWLRSEEFRPLLETWRQELRRDESMRVLIHTANRQLQKLPWHLWDLVEDYSKAEVALSALNSDVPSVRTSAPPRTRCRILVILGNRQGLDLETDRLWLKRLRHHGAEVVFLVEPRHEKLSQRLWDEKGWDILVFAGHSSSHMSGETGWIEINQSEQLSIGQLRYALKNAIDHGLQLAIFNSCDGLGLARELAQLQLPQIIVMREPVPDLVAHAFLKNFLDALVKEGSSSYLAFREARQQLEPQEQQLPGATWLPVMSQNPAAPPITWSKWYGSSGGRIAGKSVVFAQPDVRQKLLEDVFEKVNQALQSSLYKDLQLDLPMEAQPDQVQRVRDVDVIINILSKERLPPNTSIIEVFKRREVAGRLLILGEPGSGKTTTLRELARELVFQAEGDPDEPVPVLFNLSSWKDDRQPLEEWLITELKLWHGVRIDRSKELLEKKRLLPLLDGLDELESERQELCIAAINQFEQDYQPRYLVVCSRLREYMLCHTRLQLNGAVCLQPLTQEQIQRYLNNAGRLELWQSIQHDAGLLELAQVPLWLIVITLVSQETSLHEWQQLQSPRARSQYLLNAYISHILSRPIRNLWYAPGRKPTSKQTLDWLVWLAQRMDQESQTVFLIERMQPTWLQNRLQKLSYWIGIRLCFGLVGVLYSRLFHGADNSLLIAAVQVLYFVLIGGYWWGLKKPIAPIETLRWSWSEVRLPERRDQLQFYGLVYGLAFGPSLWLTDKLSGWLGLGGLLRLGQDFNKPILGLNGGLVLGLTVAVGLSCWLLFVLHAGLRGPNIERRTVPNQGIQQSAVNAGIFALVIGLIAGLPIGLAFGLMALIRGVHWGLMRGLFFGLALGLPIGLLGAIARGAACMQHFTLRVILWWSGAIPWNYAQFLNYATERRFLQKIGGSYRFMHGKLQEHLTNLKPEQIRELTSQRR